MRSARLRYSNGMSTWRCARSANPGGCPASNVSGLPGSKAITSGSSGSRGAFPYLPRCKRASMSWRVSLISLPFWSDTSPRLRGERLSCLSSVLPWPIVPDDSVEDDEQLSGDGDERHQFGLAGCDQAVEEGFQDRVVLFRHHRAHEDGSAHGCASAADEAFAPPFAGLAGERRITNKGGNLLVADLPELGQIGHKRARDDGSDARHGSDQFFLC